MPDDNVMKRDIEDIPIVRERVLHSSDIIPGTVQQRHITQNNFLVKFGLSSNRPDGTSHVRVYFATDTGVLSMWDGSSWLTTTLT